MDFLIGIVGLVGVLFLIAGLILLFMRISYNIKSIWLPISLFFGGVLGLVMALYSSDSKFVTSCLAMIVVGAGWYIKYKMDENNGVFEREKAQEQFQIEQERKAAIESQSQTSPWSIKYMTSPCPYCGHYKVRWAKWEDKRMSVAFWGGASSKIGTNYKCEHCGKMWE